MKRLFVALSIIATHAAFGDVINVPGDAPTIQAGIDLADNGDEVVIAEGVFSGDGNRNILLGGKMITVRGVNGAQGTTVSFDDTASGFIFGSGETNETRLVDLTLTGISSSDHENPLAAVLCIDGSPVVERCVFTGNAAVVDAQQIVGVAARVLADASPVFLDCHFIENDTPVFSESADALFQDCTFTGNTASFGIAFHGAPANWAHGGAVFGNGRFVDCVFTANGATTSFEPTWHGHSMRGGAMYVSTAEITRCTFRDNVALVLDENGERWGAGGAIYVTAGGVTIEDCRFESNRTGVLVGANGEETGGGAVAIVAGEVGSIGNTLFCANFPDDIKGDYVDLGGNTLLAQCPCPADLDGSGVVDFGDMLEILLGWGPCKNCPQDIDGDGRVGNTDLIYVLSHWGPC